jgi:hypothetical protein
MPAATLRYMAGNKTKIQRFPHQNLSKAENPHQIRCCTFGVAGTAGTGRIVSGNEGTPTPDSSIFNRISGFRNYSGTLLSITRLILLYIPLFFHWKCLFKCPIGTEWPYKLFFKKSVFIGSHRKQRTGNSGGSFPQIRKEKEFPDSGIEIRNRFGFSPEEKAGL